MACETTRRRVMISRTPQATLDALAYEIRERGAEAFNDPSTLGRLRELEELDGSNSRNGNVPATTRHLIVRRGDEIVPQPVEWLWPGRLAVGKQTSVAGDPGTGKTQLGLYAAAAVTTGGEWPCGEGRAPRG